MKAYRYRALPNLDDLFLIYGNACCGRNQNCSECSRDAKDNDLSSGIFFIFPYVVSCIVVFSVLHLYIGN